MKRIMNDLARTTCTPNASGGQPLVATGIGCPSPEPAWPPWRRLVAWIVILIAGSLGFSLSAFASNRADLVAGSSAVGHDWYHSLWFGYFQIDGSPHAPTGPIYHNEHGWMEIYAVSGVDEYWAWDFGLGTFLQFSDYPYVYHYRDQRWLRYSRGSAPHRAFWIVGTQDPPIWEFNYVAPEFTPEGPNGPIPVWWKEYGAIDLGAEVNNRAFVTVAQLKHVASQAREYLKESFVLTTLDWNNAFNPNPFPFQTGSAPDNSKLATAGQAKFLAKGFYDLINSRIHYNVRNHYRRLGVFASPDEELSLGYPWSEDPAPNNKGIISQAQLKVLFGFDLTASSVFDLAWVLDHAGQEGRVSFGTDSNGNGVPDYMDADPFDDRATGGQSVGVLSIVITHP